MKEELKRAIESFADIQTNNDAGKHLKVLVNLAETFLEVGEKMPSILTNITHNALCCQGCDSTGYNEALQECTKVATMMAAKRDAEIETLKKELAEKKNVAKTAKTKFKSYNLPKQYCNILNEKFWELF